MRNKRWNPALRHTVLGEPGNEEWSAARAKRTQQTNRAFPLTKLSTRKSYKGFWYEGAGRPFEKSGKELRELLKYLRVEHNGDCVVAYSQADRARGITSELEYEVYLK
jgi:hypothetical protein